MAPLQPKGSHFGLILPLCTSSATVGLSLLQYAIFIPILQAPTHNTTTSPLAGKPLSQFWSVWLAPATSVIAGFTITSAVAGVACARWLRTHQTLETTDVSSFYLYGAVLAAGHLAFAPAVAGKIQRMIAAGKESSDAHEVETVNREQQKAWLMWHTVRTVLVDVPALWCFAEGVALALWIV